MTRLREMWKSYLWQTACGTVAILIVLLVLDIQHAVVISSIGATTFIVFMKPGSPFAAPRSVVGGHLVGVLAGGVFALLPHETAWSTALVCALAVGASMLVMAVTDTEHPPAAGTALSVVMADDTLWVAIVAILTSAMLLSLFRRLLWPHLRDL